MAISSILVTMKLLLQKRLVMENRSQGKLLECLQNIARKFRDWGTDLSGDLVFGINQSLMFLLNGNGQAVMRGKKQRNSTRPKP